MNEETPLMDSDPDQSHEWSVSSGGEFSFSKIKIRTKMTYVGYNKDTGTPSGYVEDGIDVRSTRNIHTNWVRKISRLEIKV